jgi:hypothetical protein
MYVISVLTYRMAEEIVGAYVQIIGQSSHAKWLLSQHILDKHARKLPFRYSECKPEGKGVSLKWQRW